MTGLSAIDPATADPDAAQVLARARKAFGGTIPNLTRVMANSPATLHGYLDLAGALDGGLLDAHVRERIALLVAEQNNCAYCLSAHTFIAAQSLQMDPDDIAAAREGRSSDPRTNAILELASALNLGRGALDEQALDAARAAGVSDAEIAEVVGHVAANAFTNYFAKAARVPIDFPRVSPGGRAS
ncbi:MAG TPA: carboxymuconolactone decarboxylase family protein [Nocardioides sp.]|uniref:carboxymuconolactone decarboxylase family protein n=1 Tax=Nocardioides sp. TaxID=35761 RepID=UPI002E32B953|nr:carboxymuconolactone decarboxylase family protein [Nocardioides sp.]HEX5088354.1 carboxymuconolactone decarboxylase family protein [Nocardioides sp.]